MKLGKDLSKDMNFFDDIFAREEKTTFEKAYALANDAHKFQLRDEGSPYITHIDGIIEILKNELKIRGDMVLTVAALHDVLEDCDKYSYDNIKEYFGEDIANAVNLLTKSDGQDVGEYLKRIDDSEYSSWLMIVKLADRLHNLRYLKSTNNKDKIQRKSFETRKYFMDYAKRYNEYLYNQINKELEKLEIGD